MSKTHIYALVCPNTDNVRYIGKSNNPQKRLHSHLTDGRLNHRRNWLMSLKNNNQLPIVEILDTVKFEEWQFWEQYYISLYKSFGFNLLNSTIGGEGSSFHDQKTRKSFSGENNPMFGKKRPEVGIKSKALREGKTLEELYGKERAIVIKSKISKSSSKPKKFSELGMQNIKLANTDKIVSCETKELMKNNSFWKGKSGSLSPYSKPVIQYDLDGNFIKEWDSVADAERFYGSGVKACISRGTGNSRGFKWNYK